MKTAQTLVGILEGKKVWRYGLLQDRIHASILSYGGAIEEITLDGIPVTLTPSLLQDWNHNSLYTGATLAPNAGRISYGRLALPQATVSLTCNGDAHQLHGGFSNLSFSHWTLDSICETTHFSSITLTAALPDGIDGYPGNRRFSVCYALTKEGSLSLHYTAYTDKHTYINMSNHTYFNLTGNFAESALKQKLQIAAHTYTQLGADHIPVGLVSCKDSPFDFSVSSSLEAQLKKYPHHPQTEIGCGYNHGFLLLHRHMEQPVLTLTDPISTRQLSLYTDAPCLVLYSGGFIEEGLPLKDGSLSSLSCGLALECQDIPDTPNFCPKEMNITSPDHPFARRIMYQFVLPPK